MKSPSLLYKTFFASKRVVGNVDRQVNGVVFGWALDKSLSQQPVEVVAILDGKKIGETIANKWRKDIFDAGLGDGFNGFELALPQLKEPSKEEAVTIMAASTNTVLPGITARPIYAYANKYVFDLTDLFFYLAIHDNPSGIQRVQMALIVSFARSCASLKEITFVYFDESEAAFYAFDAAAVMQFMHEIQRPKSERRFSTGCRDRNILGQELGAQNQAVQFTLYNNLILLGAAWVFPDYFVAVAKVKRTGAKFFALIHDLIPLKIPSACDTGTASVFKFFLRRVVQTADLLLTVSESTASDLVEYVDRAELVHRPIKTIQNGDSTFPEISVTLPVTGEYVLYVSTIEGRKNHALALDAWERLIRKHGLKVPKLILVGRLGWRVEGLIERIYETDFLKGRLAIMEEVDDSTLAGLYSNCVFTIYPSLYEGWGLPVGESLSFGKVCVASNCTSIPEVSRGQALLFSPSERNSFFELVERLIIDNEFRTEREAVIRRDFVPITWDEVAGRLFTIVNQQARQIVTTMTFTPIGLEITFRRLKYLETNVTHGSEVAKHAKQFAKPDIGTDRLSAQNYINSDHLLIGDGWLPREDSGRWSKLGSGAKLQFNFPTGPELVVYIKFAVARVCPVNIEITLNDMPFKRTTVDTLVAVISVEVDPELCGRPIYLSIRLTEYGDKANIQESRDIGVGIIAILVLEKTDSEKRSAISQLLIR